MLLLDQRTRRLDEKKQRLRQTMDAKDAITAAMHPVARVNVIFHRAEYRNDLLVGSTISEGQSAMKATVLVEKIGKKKYPATTSQPIFLETEGTTQEQALERLYELAKNRLAGGKLFQISLPDTGGANPWQAFAGIWKDHPDYDVWTRPQ